MRVFITTLAVLIALGAQAAVSDLPAGPDRPQPALDLAPQDVVRIVLAALSNNDDPYPDAGIATTFRFASPQNKVNTGPLERFTSMVKSYPYSDMVDHQESEVSKVVMVGEDAYLLVKLITKDGNEVAYAFRLSQQRDGKFEGMWMTDAVWPVEKPPEVNAGSDSGRFDPMVSREMPLLTS